MKSLPDQSGCVILIWITGVVTQVPGKIVYMRFWLQEILHKSADPENLTLYLTVVLCKTSL